MRNRFSMLAAATLLTGAFWIPASASSDTPKGRAATPVSSRQAADTPPAVTLWDRIREAFRPEGTRWSSLLLDPTRKGERKVLAEAECSGGAEVASASCLGFRSVAEHLTAIRASEELGIPFERVKHLMQQGRTLEQAIRTLRPDVDPVSEVRRARESARKELLKEKS